MGHYYELWGGDITEKTAIIQGWGNVGATAALYLTKYGVRIRGIIDREGGLISEKGLELPDIKTLFLEREGNKLVSPDLIPFEECNAIIWESGSNIFIPAASSRLVSRDQANSMIKNGLEVVACGANVPFEDKEIFYGPIAEHVDQNVALISDFIANCGMARTFAYLMDPKNDRKITDDDIFTDVSTTIKRALKRIRDKNASKVRLGETAFELALQELI